MCFLHLNILVFIFIGLFHFLLLISLEVADFIDGCCQSFSNKIIRRVYIRAYT